MRVRWAVVSFLVLIGGGMGGALTAADPCITVEIPSLDAARAVLNRPGYVLARSRLLPLLPSGMPRAPRLLSLLARGVPPSSSSPQIRYRLVLHHDRLQEVVEVAGMEDAGVEWDASLPGEWRTPLPVPLSGAGVRIRMESACFMPQAGVDGSAPFAPLSLALHPQEVSILAVVRAGEGGSEAPAALRDVGGGGLKAGRSVLRVDLRCLPLPEEGREAWLLEGLARIMPGVAGEARETLQWLRQYTGVRPEDVLARMDGVLAADLWVEAGVRWRVAVPVRDPEGLRRDLQRALHWWRTLDPEVRIAPCPSGETGCWSIAWRERAGVLAVRAGRLLAASDEKALAESGATVELLAGEVAVWRLDPVAGWSSFLSWTHLMPLLALGAESGAVQHTEGEGWCLLVQGANAPLNTVAMGGAVWDAGAGAFSGTGRHEAYALHWLRYLAALRQTYIRLGLEAWNSPGVVPSVTEMPMHRGETGVALAGWVGRVYDPSGRWSGVALRHLERMAAGEAVQGYVYREPTHVGDIPFAEAETWAYVAVPVNPAWGAAFVVYADGAVYRQTGRASGEAAALRLPHRRDGEGWVRE